MRGVSRRLQRSDWCSATDREARRKCDQPSRGVTAMPGQPFDTNNEAGQESGSPRPIVSGRVRPRWRSGRPPPPTWIRLQRPSRNFASWQISLGFDLSGCGSRVAADKSRVQSRLWRRREGRTALSGLGDLALSTNRSQRTAGTRWHGSGGALTTSRHHSKRDPNRNLSVTRVPGEGCEAELSPSGSPGWPKVGEGRGSGPRRQRVSSLIRGRQREAELRLSAGGFGLAGGACGGRLGRWGPAHVLDEGVRVHPVAVVGDLGQHRVDQLL